MSRTRTQRQADALAQIEHQTRELATWPARRSPAGIPCHDVGTKVSAGPHRSTGEWSERWPPGVRRPRPHTPTIRADGLNKLGVSADGPT
jgi:hypothetical protein